MNEPIAGTVVHKKWKHYKTYKPKIIIPSRSGIRSVVIDEVYNNEKEAKIAAEKAIHEGRY